MTRKRSSPALGIVKEHTVEALDGSTLEVVTPTLCLRGGRSVARHVRERLAEEDVEVVGLSSALAAA